MRYGKELIMNGTIIAALPIAAMFGFAGYRVGTGRIVTPVA